jgi:hypothetical protein
MILQSPLSPRIPISALQTMPDNGSIMVLKHFSNDLCSEVLRRLYSIVPDLDDSNQGPDPPVRDLGTDIVRAWFRIMILNDSEAEALEHASRSRSIDDFLRGRQASQLESTVIISRMHGALMPFSIFGLRYVPRPWLEITSKQSACSVA